MRQELRNHKRHCGDVIADTTVAPSEAIGTEMFNTWQGRNIQVQILITVKIHV